MGLIRKLTRNIVSAPVEVLKGTVDAASDAMEWWLPTDTPEERRRKKAERDKE